MVRIWSVCMSIMARRCEKGREGGEAKECFFHKASRRLRLQQQRQRQEEEGEEEEEGTRPVVVWLRIEVVRFLLLAFVKVLLLELALRARCLQMMV